MERALRLHLLSPEFRVQPVRRSGKVRFAARQFPRRRCLGGCAEAGSGALFRLRPGLDQKAAVPGRCGLRHPGAVWPAGSRGPGLRHPREGQCRTPRTDRSPDQTRPRSTAEPRRAPPHQLPLPGEKLVKGPPHRGESRVSSGRTVPDRRLYRHQSQPAERAGAGLLPGPGHRRAAPSRACRHALPGSASKRENTRSNGRGSAA